jgi:D-galactose 1-dehydrogenase
MTPIKIAIVGLGKIATDQHVPSLRASGDFELVGAASPHGTLEGVSCFPSIEILLREVPEVEAVALCTTPQVRFEIARYALEHGCHVLLEKPPGVTVSEVLALEDIARRQGVTLFASWHSRHAPAVEPARAWLADRKILGVTVTWKESVRIWHPGQKWLWQAGGLGVFDPGINALSIVTRLIPDALVLREAELKFPSNCQTPIGARLLLIGPKGLKTQVELDFTQELDLESPQTWDISVATDVGLLHLSMGGKSLSIDGQIINTPQATEYANLYAHFAELVRGREIDVDVSPLQLVADAFLSGRHVEVADYVE